MNLSLLRKITLEKAKNELVKKRIVVYREELAGNSKSGHIEFSMTGIKECINQPCGNDVFMAKIRLISEGLEEALRTAEYIAYTDHQTHPKEHVLGYHYLKTEVGDITVYFNVQLTRQKRLVLYSITERVHT